MPGYNTILAPVRLDPRPIVEVKGSTPEEVLVGIVTVPVKVGLALGAQLLS